MNSATVAARAWVRSVRVPRRSQRHNYATVSQLLIGSGLAVPAAQNASEDPARAPSWLSPERAAHGLELIKQGQGRAKYGSGRTLIPRARACVAIDQIIRGLTESTDGI